MIQIKVLGITEQKNKRGTTLLRIVAESGGKKYTFVVKKIQYMNEQNRKSLHRLWIKEIKEDRRESGLDAKAIKKEEKALVQLSTETFEMEEDDD